MEPRFATSIVEEDSGVDAFAEAAARAALELGGSRADLVLVFAGAPNLEHADAGLEAIAERLRPGALAGCGAQGVVGSGREVEQGGVAVWAASLPGARAEAYHLEATPVGEGQVAVAGVPDLSGVDAVILLVDPFSLPADALLEGLAEEAPELPVVGGLASVPPGTGALLHDDEIEPGGAVMVLLSGVHPRCGVSQGARPIGPEMVITAAEGNVVQELASKPALARLREAIGELDPIERTLAVQGLLLGIVIDENRPEYERGDFLVRGLVGVDEQEETIAVGERVRVGQTVRLHVRDAASADEDLSESLARELGALPEPAAGALLFTCNGRGSHMFGRPGHDAAALDRALGGAPAAGFFCAGEIGPVGERNFVHGFTATFALFPREPLG